MTNYFQELSKIDASKKIEKKGQFSYLSWAHSVEELGMFDPTATWEVIRFDGLPYLKSEVGFFVEVVVTVKGVTKTQIHPVLDNRNAPISKPNSFHINTSIQRCLAKAIALHGLGLSIYYGEDILPELAQEQADKAIALEVSINADLINSAKNMDELIRVWTLIPKQYHVELEAVKNEKKRGFNNENS